MDQLIRKIDLFKNETKELSCEIQNVELVDENVDRVKYKFDYTLIMDSKCRNFHKSLSLIKGLPKFLVEDLNNDTLEVIEELIKADILIKAVNDGNF